MTRIVLFSFLITFCLLCIPDHSFSQIDSTEADSLIEEYISKAYPAGMVLFKDSSLKTEEIMSIYRSYFTDDTLNHFALIKTDTDIAVGHVHKKFQQYYDGVLVEGAQLIEHSTVDSFVYAVGGHYSDLSRSIDSASLLSSSAALSMLDTSTIFTGTESWAWKDSLWEQSLKTETGNTDTSYFPLQSSKLVWHPTNCYDSLPRLVDECIALCWRFDLLSLDPFSNMAYYIDAYTGDLVDSISLSAENGPATHPVYGTVTIDTKYESVPDHYVLHTTSLNRKIKSRYYGSGQSPSAWIFTGDISDNDDNWGTSEQIGTQTHWGAQTSWDYFENELSYSGINGNGSKIRLRPDAPTGGEFTVYMPGIVPTIHIGYLNIQDADRYLGTLDVIGHEYMHAVIAKNCDLFYEGESGALNESYADIFGACIQRDFENNTGGFALDWRIGEDVVNGWEIRDLQNPTSSGVHSDPNIAPCANSYEPGQPDTYEGQFWYDPSEDCDYGGVHINSGVNNRWFTLLADGGTHNGISVLGIGEDNAMRISWYALRHILVNSSGFDFNRLATTLAATTLYGTCSVQHQSVSDAWDAVQVPGPPANCFPSSIEDPSYVHARIYPNPSDGVFNIMFNEQFSGDIQVINSHGQVVYVKNVSDSQKSICDLSNLAQGPYFIRITNSKSATFHKIVIYK